MLKKKICLLGSFSVGKTSLVSRYVYSIFSEKYLTTIGVKIDKKSINVDDTDVDLIIWDLEGKADYKDITRNYFRGASGALLVVDGTRIDTLKSAIELKDRVVETTGEIPFVFVLNKVDLEDEWEINDKALGEINAKYSVIKTSAKTGFGVESAFQTITKMMLADKC
ncbi:MAG TPA: Rab family GTPase [Spirochaetota bacterium]|nr:MAG: Ras family protein [Spirochaetes bacterium ADurb.Bin133]HNZ25900.1 Rab family GTPase [Spirochaetota bacterium]HOF00193.1 Rab family GTPase [Spirochaetota bacterium]HOS54876.1 Rab family GTPase [Spirochaetota bacterium]HPK62077.1 Rab family GTPase [Spirochaetota bacterium]